MAYDTQNSLFPFPSLKKKKKKEFKQGKNSSSARFEGSKCKI